VFRSFFSASCSGGLPPENRAAGHEKTGLLKRLRFTFLDFLFGGFFVYKKKNVARLRYANPTVWGLISDSVDVSVARTYLIGFVSEMVRILNLESPRLRSLEWSQQIQCLEIFRKIISVRSERLTKFSLLKLLWHLIHEKYDELPENLSDGFFEEMIHLFRGMQGRSGIYDDERYPEFAELHGRKAAVMRSDQLDGLARKYLERSGKYLSGLENDIIAERKQNRDRILNVLKGGEKDWADHRWHLKHVIRDSATLGKIISLKTEEREAIDLARSRKIPFGITPYYVSLMDRESHRKKDHAVRAQVIPPLNYVRAMIANRDDKSGALDFMLEHDTSPLDLITRRYPHIVILKPYNTCSQICVYCQRNWEIHDVLEPGAMASAKKLRQAYDWLRAHPAVREVLVTGGDPLIMGDRRIDQILSELAGIESIECIRIGSRTPVVLPQRITDDLMTVIGRYHVPGKREIALVTHFEHSYEVTPEAMQAVQCFRKKGISVYNQAVFTVENSRRFELVALRRALRLIGVDPYYTFNTKGKEETKNYRVPMARLRQETKEEARLMPGLTRTDEPVYNVPGLGKNYIRALQHHSVLTFLPDGSRVYEFHPWEKNLALANTYIDKDVPISDYLAELKRRGEDPSDYQSIWYYY